MIYTIRLFWKQIYYSSEFLLLELKMISEYLLRNVNMNKKNNISEHHIFQVVFLQV